MVSCPLKIVVGYSSKNLFTKFNHRCAMLTSGGVVFNGEKSPADGSFMRCECYFMIYPMGSDSGVRRKFHEGVSFNGIWWSFVCVQFL